MDMLTETCLRTGCLGAFTPAGTQNHLDPNVLFERLLPLVYAYGTGAGIRAVAAGDHPHTRMTCATHAAATSPSTPGLRRRLLEDAAAQAVKAGRRLVLVVDGLDEDCGSLPGSGLASIAACLPKRPPDGLRVIVSGRPDPPPPAAPCGHDVISPSPGVVADARGVRRPAASRATAATPSARSIVSPQGVSPFRSATIRHRE